MKRTYAFLGLSTFSQRAAASLYRMGSTVLAIDSDEDLIQLIQNNVTRAVCADVRNRDVLRSLGVLDCDIVILGLRHHFDLTVLAVRFLTQNGVEQIIAQVDSMDELEAIRAVGATRAVFAERDAADRLVKELNLPGLVDKITLPENIGVIEIQCPEPFTGKTILDLNIRQHYQVTIIGVTSYEDGRESFIFIPSPRTVLKLGDKLMLSGHVDDVTAFVEQFPETQKE